MNWIENYKKQNRKQIEHRIEKLKAEREEYRRNYNDFPYERYRRAMERRDAEIIELKALLNSDSVKMELEDYKEELTRLRKVLHQCNILAENIEPATQKANENVRKLIGMTDTYTDNYIDESFRAAAERGIW